MRSRLHAPTSLAALLLGLACAATAQSTAADFDAKFAEVSALYRDRQYLKLEQTLAGLARLDPRRTLEAINTLEPDAQGRASLIVFGVWAQQDLRASFAWVKEHDKHFLGSAEFAHACAVGRDLSILDEALVAYGAVRSVGGPPAQSGARQTEDAQRVAHRIAEAWARVDPATIIEWARGLTARGFPAGTQYGALSGIVRVLARKSPAETFQWLETGIFIDPALDPNRNLPRGLYNAFAEGVIESSGVEAAEAFFRKQPGKRDYYLAYQPVTAALAKIAPERIEQWVITIEDTSFRKSAARSGIDKLKDTHPDLAADLFVKYTFNPKLPRSLAQLQAMMVTWAAKDAKAALAFVENTPQLTPEHRAALRAAIQPKP